MLEELAKAAAGLLPQVARLAWPSVVAEIGNGGGGNSIDGVTVLSPVLKEPKFDPKSLQAIHARSGLCMYEAWVAVDNRGNIPIADAVLSIAVPRGLVLATEDLSEDEHLPALHYIVGRGPGGATIAQCRLPNVDLAATEVRPVARFGFLGPKTGHFVFHWRVAAVDRVNPSMRWGKQRVRLLPLAELAGIVHDRLRRSGQPVALVDLAGRLRDSAEAVEFKRHDDAVP
jgi:hypothetical protein